MVTRAPNQLIVVLESKPIRHLQSYSLRILLLVFEEADDRRGVGLVSLKIRRDFQADEDVFLWYDADIPVQVELDHYQWVLKNFSKEGHSVLLFRRIENLLRRPEYEKVLRETIRKEVIRQ